MNNDTLNDIILHVVIPYYIIENSVYKITGKRLSPISFILLLITSLWFRGETVTGTVMRYSMHVPRFMKAHKEARVKKPVDAMSLAKRHSKMINDGRIVLGYDNWKNPLFLDITSSHTLLAGRTGYGKTNLINSILIQIFDRSDPGVDVFLIDLKVYEDQGLKYWKDRVEMSIYGSDYDDSVEMIEDVSQFLQQLHMSLKDRKRRFLLIIDEVIHLTQGNVSKKQKALVSGILHNLLAMARAKGAILMTVQYPKAEVLPHFFLQNMDNRLSVAYDNIGRRITFNGIPPKELAPKKPGQLLAQVAGQDFKLVNIPLVTDKDMGRVAVGVPSNEDSKYDMSDYRIQLLDALIRTLSVGDEVLGIVNASKQFKGKGFMKGINLSHCYKEFDNSGIFQNNGRGKKRTLLLDYDSSMKRLTEYINMQRWREDE